MIKPFYPRIQWRHLYQPLQPQSESLSISFMCLYHLEDAVGSSFFSRNGFIPHSV